MKQLEFSSLGCQMLRFCTSGVATLGERMSAVEREFSVTREKHMQDISRRNHRLKEEVDGCKSNLQREKEEPQLHRMERQT